MKISGSLWLVAAIVVAGCSGSDPTATHVVSDGSTPGAEQEAELAALWLSGELVAPQPLHDTIRDDLADIRRRYRIIVPETSIEFHPQYAPSQLRVGFTEDAATRIDQGGIESLPEVQSLNQSFHLTDFKKSYGWDYTHSATLVFADCWNPERLGEIYEPLDDVAWAAPNWYGGDWSNVYPWPIDGGMSYLFREGSGDCPAGCIHNVFWYFRVVGGDDEYVGTYEPGVDVEPEWWNEARRAYEAYRGFSE